MSIPVPARALPSRKLRLTVFSLLAILVTLFLLFRFLDLSPESVFVDLRFITDLGQQMFPPNMALWMQRSVFISLAETLSMAFLATVCGGGLALLFAFLAAANTAPHPLVRIAARTFLAMERSMPHLIVILVLLIAVGIGPLAGVITLTIASMGMYGKFFADSIEQAEKGTLESVESVGSTRLQTIRFAVLPQVMPSFVANLFFAFDFNLRTSVPLGIFGGGGIGFQLEYARGLVHYKDVMAYTLLIVVMITGMERISDWARRIILTQSALTAKRLA
jgi:phosphonate transport system permease protein